MQLNWKSEQGSQQNCSFQRLVTFDVVPVIRECLWAFPYMWVSVLLLIDGSYLIMLLSFQHPVCEPILTYDFLLADLATLMVIIVGKPTVCNHISAY